MKNCTKLHFYNADDEEDVIEEFFLGGKLEYDSVKDKCYYRLIKPKSSSEYIETLYILTESDKTRYINTLDISKETVTVVGDTIERTYASILPVYDIDSLKQNLECRCQILAGELPYDISIGIPLGLNLQDTQLSVLNLIKNTPEVISATINRSYRDKHTVVYDVSILSTYGRFTSTFAL